MNQFLEFVVSNENALRWVFHHAGSRSLPSLNLPITLGVHQVVRDHVARVRAVYLPRRNALAELWDVTRT